MSKYTASDLPILRSLRDAYRSLLDAANRQKADENDVGMLLAYCCVIDELQANFDRVGRSLSKLETTVAGAGRSPAVEGQGCPALPSAVGPAPGSSRVDITHSANRFLFTPVRKELPVLSAREITKPRRRLNAAN